MKKILLLLVFITLISAQDRKVFGFMPDYLLKDYSQNIRYDVLTHLAAFAFYFDRDGNVTVPYNWNNEWVSVRDKIATTNVKFIMAIFANRQTLIDSLFTYPDTKSKFFNNLEKMVIDYKFDGINLDFEAISDPVLWNKLADFIAEMTTEFHNRRGNNFEISFSGPVINWNKLDIEKMVNSCDYTFVMGYDFTGSWSPNSGPTAPLEGGYQNITTSIKGSQDIMNYKNITLKNPAKLILGMPFYGVKFHTENEMKGSKVKSWQGHIYYKDVLSLISDPKTFSYWNLETQTPWLRWKEDTTWVQIWYDDAKSLKLKMELAYKSNLGGIGFWALGQEGNRTEIWDSVKSYKYTDVENVVIPENFTLLPNFPNPFNPETTIRFISNETFHYKIIVYNLLGEEVCSLKDLSCNTGENNIKINLERQSSGTYFYKIILEENPKVYNGKFVLIK